MSLAEAGKPDVSCRERLAVPAAGRSLFLSFYFFGAIMLNLLSYDYVPGVCNIGPAERKLRLQLGEAGLGITVLFAALALAFNFATPWRLLIFIPAFVSAMGFLQYFMHFCAGFGLKGLINFSDKSGQTDTVEEAEFRRMDRNKAILILADSLLLAGLATALLAIAP